MAIKTVNNRLAVLSTLIRYATGERSKLRFKLDGMPGEIHAVAPYDANGLLAAATDDCDLVCVLLAAEAGLRAGDFRGLQWTDIKNGLLTVRRALDKRTNEITTPKHNTTRTILLSPRLAEHLAAMPKRGLFVLAGPDGEVISYDLMCDRITALYQVAGAARPPKVLHCLRRTFGAEMAKRVPLPVLRDLMGGTPISRQTTLRYVDVGEDQRAAIASVFGLAATRQRDSDARVRGMAAEMP